MLTKESKVIIDTNLWISFLISKRFSYLDNLIISKRIKLVFSQELIDEFLSVVKRPKFSKYFHINDLELLLNLFDTYGILIKVEENVDICRDPKDNFLLSLSKDSKADFLLTGDDDLLALGKYGKTKIMKIGDFEKLF